MANIRIVTDSTADIPAALAQSLSITVIPLSVHINGSSYLDREEISNKELYDYLATDGPLPTTSQPTPAQFIQTYRGLADAGAEIIFSLHLSGDLSGTANGAVMAAKEVADTVDVRVIDSRSATMGLGLLVVVLAQMLEKGASSEALETFVHKGIDELKIYFLLNSLDNLEKGGRIGKASYLVGSILNIKPLLMLSNGVIQAHKKIRGKKPRRALQELAKTVAQEIDPKAPLHLAIGYNDDLAAAKVLAADLSELLARPVEATYFELGSVVSTHIGLGAVGAAFFQTEVEGV